MKTGFAYWDLQLWQSEGNDHLIECYKILSGKENLDPYQFFQRSDTTHLRGLSQRVIIDWNKLPQDVVDAPSVNAFTNRLDTHWKNTGYGH